MEEHVPGDEEVESKFHPPNIEDALDWETPDEIIVQWNYNKKASDEFLVDDAFVQTMEFKEFIIQQRRKEIKETLD